MSNDSNTGACLGCGCFGLLFLGLCWGVCAFGGPGGIFHHMIGIVFAGGLLFMLGIAGVVMGGKQ